MRFIYVGEWSKSARLRVQYKSLQWTEDGFSFVKILKTFRSEKFDIIWNSFIDALYSSNGRRKIRCVTSWRNKIDLDIFRGNRRSEARIVFFVL